MWLFSDFPASFRYVGCYIDQSSSDLEHRPNKAQHTDTTCAEECKQYTYFGLQERGKCYCGNGYGTYGKAEESECHVPCSGDPTKSCGGWDRNAIYKYDPGNSIELSSVDGLLGNINF